MKRALIVIAVIMPMVVASAGDWPQWRHDASRSGYSPEPLPDDLMLHWTRELPKPEMAWPVDPRVQFDATVEPVVLGKTLFVGSTTDGSVTAVDTATGRQKWKAYTEGPVRFAPLAAKGRVYAASDDGRLYCWDAETGAQRWVFRAAPATRPDLRHLGNNRLISCWPVRGAPVLVGNTIVLASGIWPLMGTFVYAVDADSGELRWCNDKAHRIAGVRLDHLVIQEAGIAPQGYGVCENGRLILPNGRSQPSGFDAATGKLLWFCQGGRNGHWRVAARGKHAFVGEAGVVNTDDGREVGSNLYIHHNPGSGRWVKHFVSEAPHLPYKKLPSVSAWSVFVDQTVYGIHDGTVYAHDLAKAALEAYDTTVRKEPVKPNRWVLPELWRLATGEKARGRTLIGAGDRLYGHAGATLLAVDLPKDGGKPQIAWKKTLPGKPTTMLAADNRLFVVCDGGTIHCFGPGAMESKTWKQTVKLLGAADAVVERTAGEILKESGGQEGYCLVLGLTSGRLCEEIVKQSRLRVLAVDADAAKVRAIRERMAAAGLYGSRVEVFTGDPLQFAFPPCIAGLIVSECYGATDLMAKAPSDRLLPCLQPYGGVMCLRAETADKTKLERWARTWDTAGAEVSCSNGWALLRRPGPPPGSVDWTHGCADAARTYFSRDDNVKLPLTVLWYGEGDDHGFHKANDYGRGSKPQVVDGRMFAFRVRDHTLHAIDIYTGRKLWQEEVAPFTRYASMPEGVYVAEGSRCTLRDPATGRIVKTYPYAVDGMDKMLVGDIRVDRDAIVIGVAPHKERNIVKGLWDSTVLVGLDRSTGKQLWTHRSEGRLNIHGLAMGEGLVFCADSASVAKTAEMQRRGSAPDTLTVTFTALDARTGEVRWRQVKESQFATYNHFMAMRSFDDWVAYAAGPRVVLAGKNQHVFAFQAATGEPLWERKGHLPQPIILRNGEFISQTGQIFDVATGEPTGKRAFAYRGYGCNYGIGGKHLFIRRAGTMALFDVATSKIVKPVSTRSGCSHSTVPACGVLTVANFMDHCVCNYPVQTSYALIHSPIAAGWYDGPFIEEPLRKSIDAASRADAKKKGKGQPAKSSR